MKVKEIMERAGITQTGRAIAYIKDAMEEINTLTEANIRVEQFNLKEDTRAYTMPAEAIKLVDIRVKNHLNSKDEYRSIPRLVYEPTNKDTDSEEVY